MQSLLRGSRELSEVSDSGVMPEYSGRPRVGYGDFLRPVAVVGEVRHTRCYDAISTGLV